MLQDPHLAAGGKATSWRCKPCLWNDPVNCCSIACWCLFSCAKGLCNRKNYRLKCTETATLRHYSEDVGVWRNGQWQKAVWDHQHRAWERQVSSRLQTPRECGKFCGLGAGRRCKKFYTFRKSFVVSILQVLIINLKNAN